ncbi:THUMP domain-containing protein 2-like [Athene cunicularia]|uniref:THUMP domain-containing protein 2-like n=1 Tax=Athene cunicularia TaxID=194338 RepID=UPI000EF6E48F|nr:THUMP domain-containing protein 2-like [Athene cunicularia]
MAAAGAGGASAQRAAGWSSSSPGRCGAARRHGEAELGELRKLKSGERLFLLLKNHPPLAVSRNKGKMLHEIKSLVIDEPKYWLDVLSIWKNSHGCEGEKKWYVSREDHKKRQKLQLKAENGTDYV